MEGGHLYREGDRVRFSPLGAARVRSMPEAWGLHTALQLGEVGVVVETDPGHPEQVSVEFPSGAAWYWDAACFARVEDPLPGPDG